MANGVSGADSTSDGGETLGGGEGFSGGGSESFAGSMDNVSNAGISEDLSPSRGSEDNHPSGSSEKSDVSSTMEDTHESVQGLNEAVARDSEAAAARASNQPAPVTTDETNQYASYPPDIAEMREELDAMLNAKNPTLDGYLSGALTTNDRGVNSTRGYLGSKFESFVRASVEQNFPQAITDFYKDYSDKFQAIARSTTTGYGAGFRSAVLTSVVQDHIAGKTTDAEFAQAVRGSLQDPNTWNKVTDHGVTEFIASNLPVIGTGMDVHSAYSNFKEGNYVFGTIDGVSAAASMIPGGKVAAGAVAGVVKNIADFVKPSIARRADEIFSSSNRAGSTFDTPNGGQVVLEGPAANAAEIQYALEIADQTKSKVTIRGRDAAGGDLLIEGVDGLTELKSLTEPTLRSVGRHIEGAGRQAARTVIDGRTAGLSKGTAVEALEAAVRSGKISDEVKEIVIHTKQGIVRYSNGEIIK